MSALELLREKKHNQEPLTAIEKVILDEWYNAPPTHEWMLIIEQAANELAHMQERIKEHLPK